MRALAALMTVVVLLLIANPTEAQDPSVESRLSKVEREVKDRSAGAVLFLFGAFCALWAQNTGRSAWVWFFLGLLFSVLTVVVLLAKNSNDRKSLAAARSA